jgi:hypothetical protein
MQYDHSIIVETVGEKRIEDPRSLQELRKITLTGYSKAEILKIIKDGMFQNQIETVCHWVAELHCCGHYSTMWKILEEYYWKYINITNIRFWKYYMIRYKRWREIMETYKKEKILESRNNNEIRSIFMDLFTILMTSVRHYEFVPPKIKETEIRPDYIGQKMEYQNHQNETKLIQDFIEGIFSFGVNNEIKLVYYEIYSILFFTTSPSHIEIVQKNFQMNNPINTPEGYVDVSKHMKEWKQKQFHKILYWMEWLQRWIIVCKKRGENIIDGQNMQNIHCFDIYRNTNLQKREIVFHWVLFYWEFLEKMVKFRAIDSKTREFLGYLRKIFIQKWKGNFNGVKNIVYLSIYLFFMGMPKQKTLIYNKKVWYQVCLMVDDWYEEVLKNCNEYYQENWNEQAMNIPSTLSGKMQGSGQSMIQFTDPDMKMNKPKNMKQMEKQRKMEEANRMMRKLNYLDNLVLCKKNPNVRDYFDGSGSGRLNLDDL